MVPAQVLQGQQVSKALLYPVLQKACVCSALRGQQHHSLIDWCPLWDFVAPGVPLGVHLAVLTTAWSSPE